MEKLVPYLNANQHFIVSIMISTFSFTYSDECRILNAINWDNISIDFDNNEKVNYIEEVTIEKEKVEADVLSYKYLAETNCSCHDEQRIDGNELIWKCRDTSCCKQWYRLNKEQQDFIRFINTLANDVNIFNNDHRRYNATEKQHIGQYGNESFYYLFNFTNQAMVVFLNGMGGTGKTEVLKFIHNHTSEKIHYMNLKHILLSNFYNSVCKKHGQYNTTFPSNARIYLSTLAKLCYGIGLNDTADVTYNDFAQNLCTRLHVLAKGIRTTTDTYICIIDEYSTVSPAMFVCVSKMIREISSKTIFIVCGDQHQCKPINTSNTIDGVNYETLNIQKDALPNKLLDVAYTMYGKNRVFEYTLKTLIRSSEDNDLQSLIQHMWNNAHEDYTHRILLLNNFIIAHNIPSNSTIDITNVADKYIQLIHILENAKGNDECETAIRTFNIPFKIIAVANETCTDVAKQFFDALYTQLSKHFDSQILKKYFACYYVGQHVQYLATGCTYKITSNIKEQHSNTYGLLNGSIVKLMQLVYVNAVLEHLLVLEEYSGKIFRIYPYTNYTDNVIRDTDNKQIRHIGFPLHLNMTENAFQIQGMTLLCDVYLDCSHSTNEYLYVMFSRFKKSSQLKAVINL